MTPFDTYKPPGFHTMNAYITTSDAPALISFLKQAFDAVEHNRTVSDDGIIRNCILQMGDSSFMIGQPLGNTAMPGMFYLFCQDPDALYTKAMKLGATSVMPVADQSQGDRQGGIKDCSGNIWWLSKRLVEAPYTHG